MKRRKSVLIAFGTRPEAVKIAPVLNALEADKAFEVEALSTAQHREMLDQTAAAFDLRIDHDLNLMRDRQTLDGLTARILTSATPVLELAAPDAVLVHGDTTTALALALASFYRQIPVGHVEAGLRSGNRYSPFPEEMNRRLISSLSTWHYAPTEGNRANLLAQGVDPDSIRVTGNTVIDALLETVSSSYRFEEPALEAVDFDGLRVLGLTCHRRENLGEPLGYADFSNFMARCAFMLTDSGGVQEEAPALDVPVLVLRDDTERPEALEAGCAALVGTTYEGVRASCEALLGDAALYARMAVAPDPYGDGHAAERICSALHDALD